MRRHIVTVVLAAALGLGPSGAQANGAAVDPLQVASAIEERTAFGLPADPVLVRGLLTNGSQRGRAEWGMVVTDEELLALDLPGRMEFAAAAEDGVLRYARSLATYGGAYFDQTDGGSLTVLLTDTDDADSVLRLAPAGNRKVVVSLVGHTLRELHKALEQIREIWPTIYPETRLLTVAVDPRRNLLRAEVHESDLVAVSERVRSLAEELGVPVALEPGEPEVPAVCSARNNCHTPMRGGIEIRRSSATGARCTMGYMITRSGDEQFATAGHCSYDPGTSEAWYHPGYGLIGWQTSNYFVPDGSDAMTVAMTDSQASNRIYGESRVIVGWGYPTVGGAICASLSTANVIDCGTVADDFLSYELCTNVCRTIFGFSASGIAIQLGDSGGPVYVRLNSTQVSVFGTISTLSGKSARIDGYRNNGWWIFTG